MVELLSHSLNRMFHNISRLEFEETKDQLSALDGAIGDADHGVTMSIGFQAVKAELSRRNVDAMAPADLMNTAAMAFLNSVGAFRPVRFTRPDCGAQHRRLRERSTRRRKFKPRSSGESPMACASAARDSGATRRCLTPGTRRRRLPAHPCGGRQPSDRCGGKSLPPPRRARTRPVQWSHPRDERRDWANGRSDTSIPARRAPWRF